MRGREEDYRNFKDGGVTHNGGGRFKNGGCRSTYVSADYGNACALVH